MFIFFQTNLAKTKYSPPCLQICTWLFKHFDQCHSKCINYCFYRSQKACNGNCFRKIVSTAYMWLAVKIYHVFSLHTITDSRRIRLYIEVTVLSLLYRGRGSSIGSEFAWHASGPEFDPHVRHILSWRLGHENISTAILPLPLIQEEQLSVTGERMCTKYW